MKGTVIGLLGFAILATHFWGFVLLMMLLFVFVLIAMWQAHKQGVDLKLGNILSITGRNTPQSKVLPRRQTTSKKTIKDGDFYRL
jgi:predicted branched-subunit amino acid permease